MDPSKFFVEFLFGLIGAAYLVYGKKRGNMVALACGLGLGLFPYFVDNFLAVVLIGILLAAAPFLFRNR